MNQIPAPTPTKLILKGTRHSIFTLWKDVPFERVMEFKPLSLSALKQVAVIINGFASKPHDESASTVAFSLSIAGNDIDQMAQVVAIAAEKFPGRKRRQLKRMILENTTTEELSNLYQIVIDMMDLANFLKSIVLVRGVNILGPTVKDVPIIPDLNIK